MTFLWAALVIGLVIAGFVVVVIMLLRFLLPQVINEEDYPVGDFTFRSDVPGKITPVEYGGGAWPRPPYHFKEDPSDGDMVLPVADVTKACDPAGRPFFIGRGK